MERDAYAPGTPSWVDLESPDTDASAAFYGGLFGWECSEPADYRMFTLRGRNVAGLGPQLNPGPPHWTTYVNVASCDEAAEGVRSLGGTPFFAPMDIGDVGRLCVVADPTGAVLALWEPGTHHGAGLVDEPGAWCRSVLSTRDVPAVEAFYSALFGWEPGDWVHETPAFVPAEVPAHWLVHFGVADVDATVATAQSSGGTLVFRASSEQATLLDPHGAMFAVVSRA